MRGCTELTCEVTEKGQERRSASAPGEVKLTKLLGKGKSKNKESELAGATKRTRGTEELSRWIYSASRILWTEGMEARGSRRRQTCKNTWSLSLKHARQVAIMLCCDRENLGRSASGKS
jgi:hypothetical protein